MDLQALKKMIRRGEGQGLEFKLKANNPEKIVKEMIAFANSSGGMLIVGVQDDKKIEGVKSPDEDEYIIQKAIEKYIIPPLRYQLERIPIDANLTERELLVYHIPKAESVYHSFIEYSPKKQYKTYIRLQDKTIQASREMREVLKGKAKQRNIKFHFGEKEKILMQYLTNHQHISVAEFANLANISLRLASRTLVLLVLARILEIIPHLQKADTFALSNSLSADVAKV